MGRYDSWARGGRGRHQALALRDDMQLMVDDIKDAYLHQLDDAARVPVGGFP